MSAPYDSHGGSQENPPSIGELLSVVGEDLSLLLQQELALAKAEAKQTATRAGKGVAMLAGAGLAGFFVLLFLSTAAWWSLGNAIGRGWSALVVMLIWAVVTGALVVVGRGALAKAKGMPKTSETVKDIPGALTPHPQSAQHAQPEHNPHTAYAPRTSQYPQERR